MGFLEAVGIDTERFGSRFEIGYLSRKAAREMGKFLDSQGEENVRWLVETKTDIVSLIPPEALKAYKENARTYRWALGKVQVNKVWEYLDKRWKEVILSYPEGEVWAKAQMGQLMEVFFGRGKEAG